MIIIKPYLKAIKHYEEQYNSFELLIDYFSQRKSSLAKLYCQGRVRLPSFMLIKKLQTKFAPLASCDTELNKLFVKASITSKLFYSKLITLIIETKNSPIKFERKFAEEIQPIGQRLTNLLINIKYRIRFTRIQRQQQYNSGLTLVSKITNSLLYKLTLMNSAHHSLTRKLYYILIILAIAVIWVVNLAFGDNISGMSPTFINIFTGLAIVIIAIISYPIDDFGTFDISGRNIVAYRYKVFFNNFANSKMLNVFTLQNSGDDGQAEESTVESTQI